MNPISVVVAAAAATGYFWHRSHDASPAVQTWQPSALTHTVVGGLESRVGGEGRTGTGPMVVLLHGLVATGDIFGAAFDPLAEQATLVVPDLLGFGRSLDEDRSTFTVHDHLDALDAVVDALDVGDRPIVVGAHSMGAAIGLAWAARRGHQVRAIACWGPPVYTDDSAVKGALADTGLMARLLAGSNRVARAACRLNCRNRALAGWLAATATPSLPVSIARRASLHTWPAYRDAIEDVVAGTDWAELAQIVSDSGTAISMTWGVSDTIGDRAAARSLEGVEVHIVEDAGHHLPLTHPDTCTGQVLTGLASS